MKLKLRNCPFCGRVPEVQPWHAGKPTKVMISCPIKPSAKSSLMIDYGNDEYLTLISKEFEAETPAEVFTAVEQWAQEQMDRVVSAVREVFSKEEKDAASPTVTQE